MINIGSAGWSIPRQCADCFEASGSRLERYASRLHVAEINSTFYRSHREQTYLRWAEAVPPDFRFAVKLPKAITHERRLAGTAGLLDRFLQEVRVLGEKLGPLLIQLPPSLAFDAATVGAFLEDTRKHTKKHIVCEPRHPTWFLPEADCLLQEFEVARVAADPPKAPLGAEPGGWAGLAYFRLHGSPRVYFSEYDHEFIKSLARRLRATTADEIWCIFDNTASAGAIRNALALSDILSH